MTLWRGLLIFLKQSQLCPAHFSWTQREVQLCSCRSLEASSCCFAWFSNTLNSCIHFPFIVYWAWSFRLHHVILSSQRLKNLQTRISFWWCYWATHVCRALPHAELLLGSPADVGVDVGGCHGDAKHVHLLRYEEWRAEGGADWVIWGKTHRSRRVCHIWICCWVWGSGSGYEPVRIQVQLFDI